MRNRTSSKNPVEGKRSLSRTYLVPLLFLLLGLACHAAFGIIGAEIAPDGRLVEPFFLLPIGYLLYALSIIASLIIRYSNSVYLAGGTGAWQNPNAAVAWKNTRCSIRGRLTC